MNQAERRLFLIKTLLAEDARFRHAEIPDDEEDQKSMLRSLFNIRMPRPISEEFIKVQDEYLQETLKTKGITDFSTLQPVKPGIYLWRGDITTLRCDAIVNAANNQMLGCFAPCHRCIDNAIHTFSGIQLREACAKFMAEQKHPEPTGQAKITPAFTGCFNKKLMGTPPFYLQVKSTIFLKAWSFISLRNIILIF